MQFPRRKTASGGASSVGLADRPFLEEMRAVEKLLPIAPDEINRRVLTSRLDEADLAVAERLNATNLRYFETVVRPVLDEWVREVHARRTGQACAFVASCAALGFGCFANGMAAYFLFFVGTFGFCTGVAAWFGGPAASVGTRLVARVLRRGGSGNDSETA